jgi:hypothetical protein
LLRGIIVTNLSKLMRIPGVILLQINLLLFLHSGVACSDGNVKGEGCHVVWNWVDGSCWHECLGTAHARLETRSEVARPGFGLFRFWLGRVS